MISLAKENKQRKLKSCIYEGAVFHNRLEPTPHRFLKRLYLLYLDLSELEQVFRGRWLWSTTRSAMARFSPSDHFGDASKSLQQNVDQLLSDSNADDHQRPSSICLLTQLLHFGYGFNPLSLFYCYGAQQELQTVIAEVSNTPWKERHCYVLTPDSESENNANDLFEVRNNKQFHVSPFMPMDMQYRWHFNRPAEDLTVGIENWREGKMRFEVGMSMVRRRITSRSLAWMLCRYPFMPQQIIASIYWQAFRLWRKRTPFFSHPSKLAQSESTWSGSLESETN